MFLNKLIKKINRNHERFATSICVLCAVDHPELAGVGRLHLRHRRRAESLRRQERHRRGPRLGWRRQPQDRRGRGEGVPGGGGAEGPRGPPQHHPGGRAAITAAVLCGPPRSGIMRPPPPLPSSSPFFEEPLFRIQQIRVLPDQIIQASAHSLEFSVYRGPPRQLIQDEPLTIPPMQQAPSSSTQSEPPSAWIFLGKIDHAKMGKKNWANEA